MKFTCVHCNQKSPIEKTELEHGVILTCANCGLDTTVLLTKGNRNYFGKLKLLEKSNAPQITINRWMKSERIRYPHFILYQQEGNYRSACGRVVVPDMKDLSAEELAAISRDYYGRNVCGSCFHSTRRHERDPLLEEWRKARNR
jgi:hypothetical protein